MVAPGRLFVVAPGKLWWFVWKDWFLGGSNVEIHFEKNTRIYFSEYLRGLHNFSLYSIISPRTSHYLRGPKQKIQYLRDFTISPRISHFLWYPLQHNFCMRKPQNPFSANHKIVPGNHKKSFSAKPQN